MKSILSITIALALLTLVSVSCNKSNNQSQSAINAQLSQTETVMIKSYQIAKLNADSLSKQVGLNGHYTNSVALTEDRLYHMNDSLFNLNYLSYCKDMMDGDNMMGSNGMGSNGSNGMGGASGNMMGNTQSSNAVHGSGMMATHSYLGDTTKLNKYYRDLILIRQNHNAHHPIPHQ